MKIEPVKNEPFAKIELTRDEFDSLNRLLRTCPITLSPNMHKLHCAIINFLDAED